MTESITRIWGRALQRKEIGFEDNFFDLGGDPSSAIQVFADIAQVCSRQLPPEMIYLAPTIRSLAGLLGQSSIPRFPPLVLLKPGTEDPPVFIMHGLSGSVMELFHVVRHFHSRHPIYGMQARGIDDVDEPFKRVEDIAQYCLDAVKKLQPRGPYCLIGYSFGGLVAFEMSQRLSEIGEDVALLTLLDTYPHPHYLPLIQRVQHIVRRASRASNAMRLRTVAALSGIIRSLAYRFYISPDASRSVSRRPPIEASTTPGLQPVRYREDSYLAFERYRPRFYKGKVKFVTPRIKSSHWPSDPAAIWDRLSNEFELETVPGQHMEMIGKHAESVASVLSRYIEEAFGEESLRDNHAHADGTTEHYLSPR